MSRSNTLIVTPVVIVSHYEKLAEIKYICSTHKICVNCRKSQNIQLLNVYYFIVKAKLTALAVTRKKSDRSPLYARWGHPDVM